ncbi:MAG: hypothetical protein SGI87_08075 [Flavobacteriales bacterium]|nr:hypothetical protein [Flavobacteriales bacterium]
MNTEIYTTGLSHNQNFSRSTYAFSANEIMQTVLREIAVLRKSGKTGLDLIQDGIQRLQKMGLINPIDAKKLKDLAILLIKLNKGAVQRASVSGKIDELFHSMILNENHSDLATGIVNSMRSHEPTPTATQRSAKKAAGDNGSSALVSMGGALTGAIIGGTIGGGLGAFIGFVIGGAAGAIAEGCLD